MRYIPIENRVKQFRIQKNESQSILAQKIGVSRQTIINIEKGINPTIEVMFLLAEHFEVPATSLFFPSKSYV